MLPTGGSALHFILVLTLVVREAIDSAYHIGCPAPDPGSGGDYAYYYYGFEVNAISVVGSPTGHIAVGGGSLLSVLLLVVICCCCCKREGKKREAKTIVLK